MKDTNKAIDDLTAAVENILKGGDYINETVTLMIDDIINLKAFTSDLLDLCQKLSDIDDARAERFEMLMERVQRLERNSHVYQ